MKGKELIAQLTEDTDVPKDLLRNELLQLIREHNSNENTLTLDELREIVAGYLQDVFVSVKQELG